jgi:catechol 2,3-dioxygenase-like lactoylglutathione lyase family enzyme
MKPMPIRQIAYFVPDIREAARRHHALFGSGPYYVADNIALFNETHRGVARSLDHSSAYGQWGNVMIEFVQQNNPGPSAFHDVYPEGSGRYGIHHVALFVDDVDAELARLNRDGTETAFRAETGSGFAFAFADSVATHGHMIELYPPVPQLTGFYDMVAAAAESFNGSEVIIPLAF